MPLELAPTAAVAGLLATAIGIVAACHALTNKRRPESAFGWIAVCLALPVLGAMLYFLFGINRVRGRARLLRRRSTSRGVPLPLGEQPLCFGNRVTPLHNGEQAYPAMLDAIMQSERRVYLSSYLFDTSDIGRAFVIALGDATARGADVHVLLDGIGELHSFPRASRLLRRFGVPCGHFLPPRLVPPSLHINLRNHRKVLIADDAAFVGGMNIAHRHLVDDAAPSRAVADLHFELHGPVVEALVHVFAGDWEFSTGEKLATPPRLAVARGDAECRVVTDGPDDDTDPLIALLLRSVGSANRRIAIMTPYFLPPRTLMGALLAAALRGVEVTIVLPEKNNLPYVHWASRNLLWELLKGGIRVCYRPPPFAHTKLLLIDDECAVVGSWNLDPRSLRLNFELAVDIRDAALVDKLDAHFADVRTISRSVSLEEVDGRSFPARLRDGTAWLFSPYL